MIRDGNGNNFTYGSNAYISSSNTALINDLDSNGVKDFIELPSISIISHPVSITVEENLSSSFTVTATSASTSLNYQWQFASSSNNPLNWANVTNSGSSNYTGINSPTLQISPTLDPFSQSHWGIPNWMFWI